MLSAASRSSCRGTVPSSCTTPCSADTRSFIALTRVSCERLSCTAVASISSLFGRVSDSYRSARFGLAAGLCSLPSGASPRAGGVLGSRAQLAPAHAAAMQSAPSKVRMGLSSRPPGEQVPCHQQLQAAGCRTARSLPCSHGERSYKLPFPTQCTDRSSVAPSGAGLPAAPFATGYYVGESDVIGDPERARRSFAPDARARLAAVRRMYDSAGAVGPPADEWRGGGGAPPT